MCYFIFIWVNCNTRNFPDAFLVYLYFLKFWYQTLIIWRNSLVEQNSCGTKIDKEMINFTNFLIAGVSNASTHVTTPLFSCGTEITTNTPILTLWLGLINYLYKTRFCREKGWRRSYVAPLRKESGGKRKEKEKEEIGPSSSSLCTQKEWKMRSSRSD